MSELRSLRQLGGASFAGQALSFSPPSATSSWFGLSGLEAPVKLENAGTAGAAALGFELQLKMAGSREVMVIPVGSTTLVYGILYALVVSEDYALLGAIVLLAILGAVMRATRNVDWYRLQQPTNRRERPALRSAMCPAAFAARAEQKHVCSAPHPA